MNKDFFNVVLKDKVKNSLNGEKLIKEIAFTEEIDKDRSDRFFVDVEEGVLHFLYHISNTVYADDLLRIFGEVNGDGHFISMFPRIEKSIGDTVKRSHVLYTKPIKQDADIIEIDFNHSPQGIFYYHFINEYNCEIRKRFATGDLEYTSENLSDRSNEYIISTFNEKTINIRQYEGLDVCDDNSFHGLSCGLPLKYIVNLKSNFSYVIQENMKKVFFDFRYRDGANRYILLGYNSKPEVQGDMALLINRINYGIQNGYVYLKPLNFIGNRIKIKMLFSGDPEFQYYFTKEQAWKTIKNDDQINRETDMNFRLKMSCGDSIYRLYVLEA